MYSPSSENQWEPVVIHNKSARQSSADVQTVKKLAGEMKATKNLEKDIHSDPTQEAPEQKPLPRLSKEDQVTMIKARTERKLTQVQLAQMINEQSAVIKDIEGGKIITDKKVLTKIGRVLGIKLKC